MNIGVPKEIALQEKRVGLVPCAVDFLVNRGHNVYVESDAGVGSGATDEMYKEAGATIVYNHKEPFQRADLVIKVMPPTKEEATYLREDSVLLSSLELGLRSKSAMQELIKSGVTALGYEILEDEKGNLPVMQPMSEITGMLLPSIAAHYLMEPHGGKGIVLGGVAGLLAAKVVIIGAGTVGITAAKGLLNMGARVILMDRDVSRLRHAKEMVGSTLRTQLAIPFRLREELKDADVLITAVFERGNTSPVVINKELLSRMPDGGLVIVVDIDQGGSIEGVRPTRISDPVYVEDGKLIFAVPNIPSTVPRAASTAISNVVLSFVDLLEDLDTYGIDRILKGYPQIQKGVYAYKGRCTHKRIAEFADLAYEGPCCNL